MTGFSFCVFGLGALLLSTFFFNLLNCVIRDDKKRHELTQKSIRYSFKLFLLLTKITGVLDYRISNIEKLSEDDGCLVVANHPNLLDYVLITSVMPKCTCIVKNTLLNNFFMKGVIKAAGYIPNNDPEQLLKDCHHCLVKGDMILVFPEGTRTVEGEPFKLQRGAANIAIRSRADIRIVSIFCSEVFLTKNKKWYHVPLRKPVFNIEVGRKLSINSFIHEDAASLAIDVRKLTGYLTGLLNPNAEK